MRRFGWVVVLVGVLIAVFGMGQFARALALSTDTNPNPVGNGMLMALGLVVGEMVAGIGLAMVGGRFRRWV
jgi:hypothetical protein